MLAERSAPDMRRQGPLSKASRAPAIAASTWTAEACCNEPMILPVGRVPDVQRLALAGGGAPANQHYLAQAKIAGLGYRSAASSVDSMS